MALFSFVLNVHFGGFQFPKPVNSSVNSSLYWCLSILTVLTAFNRFRAFTAGLPSNVSLMFSTAYVAGIRFISHWRTNSRAEVNWLNWTNQISRRKNTKSRAFCERGRSKGLWMCGGHTGHRKSQLTTRIVRVKRD